MIYPELNSWLAQGENEITRIVTLGLVLSPSCTRNIMLQSPVTVRLLGPACDAHHTCAHTMHVGERARAHTHVHRRTRTHGHTHAHMQTHTVNCIFLSYPLESF